MKIIRHIEILRWLGPNVWWEISQIWIEYLQPVGQMSDESWKFFRYTECGTHAIRKYVWYYHISCLLNVRSYSAEFLQIPGLWLIIHIMQISWRINSLRPSDAYMSKLTTIGLDNGLLPGRRQAIIWTNDGILLFRTLGTNFSEILSKIHSFSFKKMHLKMASAKWLLFRLGLNELIEHFPNIFHETTHLVDFKLESCVGYGTSQASWTFGHALLNLFISVFRWSSNRNPGPRPWCHGCLPQGMWMWHATSVPHTAHVGGAGEGRENQPKKGTHGTKVSENNLIIW